MVRVTVWPGLCLPLFASRSAAAVNVVAHPLRPLNSLTLLSGGGNCPRDLCNVPSEPHPSVLDDSPNREEWAITLNDTDARWHATYCLDDARCRLAMRMLKTIKLPSYTQTDLLVQ